MKDAREAPDIPRHISLSSQAAAFIRKRIDEGLWHERLPSERALAEILQVSRPTVRQALQQLGEEGVFEMRQGCRKRLLKQRKPSQGIKNQVIGLITHEPFAAMISTPARTIGHMREYLIGQGLSLVPFICQPGSVPAEQKRIETFLRQNEIFCCILISVSKGIQRWFVEHKIPALVLGSCHPSVTLPSLDVDYRSVCRHAAGVFLRQGHRCIALVTPNSTSAGDIAGEQGFREAVANYPEAKAIIVRHNGTAQNMNARLDALLNSQEAPTALLVNRPLHVFAVIVHLLKRRLSIPEEISLIARDGDARFMFSQPRISCYEFEPDTYMHRLSRLLIKLINREAISNEPRLIFPRYIEGGTVMPPPGKRVCNVTWKA